MLEKLYTNKTDKELKFALNLYYGLLIVSVILPILFNVFSYYSTEKIHLTKSLPFVLILAWSLFNIDYLKNKLKK